MTSLIPNCLGLRRRKTRAAEHGASLTEFLIVGPVAILMTFVILQSGMLYMAKLTLNNATFMAARAGATDNAKKSTIQASLVRGLIPFYQDTTNSDDFSRLTAAAVKATADVLMDVKLDILSPSKEAFNVYGISANGVRYIPNDNLEFRTATPMNGASISIQDANILRIKVTYGYKLKVPLMAAVLKRIMCPGVNDSGIQAWDSFTLLPLGAPADCYYYLRDRMPIVAFATVQMQSPSQQ